MSERTGGVQDVGIEELKSGLRDGTITLVDVREPNEFAAGAIPGSVSMPLSSFDPASLPGSGRVVFSCAAGVRSARVVEYLQAEGLPFREHFAPGFKGWLAAGEPAELERS